MTVDATLNFDALTEGAAFSPSSPWSTSGLVPTVKAASAANGAKGLHYDSTDAYGRVQYDFGSNQTNRPVVAAMNFRVPTIPAVNLYLSNIMSAPTGGTSQADWRLNPAGTVSIRNGNTAVATSTKTLLSNRWYHAEWKVEDAANTQTLRIYELGDTTPIFELTGAYSSVLTRTPTFGPVVAAAGGVIDLDDLTVANDWTVTTGGPAVTPVLLDFDSQSDAAAYSPVSPWSTNGVVPTVKTAAAKHGARGIQWASTGSAGRVQYDFGASLTVPLVMSSYLRIPTMASAALSLGAVYSAPTSGTIQADWRVNTSGTVSIRNQGASVATSVAVLAANTWYRASWKVDPAAGTQELRIYAGEGTTPLLTLTGAYSGAGATRTPSFGPNTAAAGGALDMDTLRLAADWPGPFDTSVHRVWNRKRADNSHTGLIAHRKV